MLPVPMDTDDYEIIRQATLFKGLEPEVVRQIIGNRAVRHFDKGQMIFQQGDNANHFYVVVSGWVKLFRQMPSGEEAILHLFTQSETFAEAAMFADHVYPASAEAVAETRLLAVDCERFQNELREVPEIAMRMLAATTTHLKHLVMELEQIKGRNSIERLSFFLLGLCRDDVVSDVVRLPYEKSLIAARLGIKPESLSRTLKQLRGYGIECVKNQIVVSDVKALRKLAMGGDLQDDL